MTRLIFIFSAIFSFSTGVFAQKAILRGKVTEKENNAPIISAKVVIDVTKGLAASTNVEGNYEIKLDPGTYKVKYFTIGKEEHFEQVTVEAGETKIVNVGLANKVYEAMKQVVISSSRYEKKVSEETVTIEVLKTNVLQQNNITRVDEGLNKVPGVTITEGQANIRGGSGWSYGAGSRVMVLLDDIPSLTADANDAKWSFMPIENVEQIEVIKGAASSIYGNGALNGVINIRTGYAKAKPETRISMWGGWNQAPSNQREAWWLNDVRFKGTDGFLMFNKNQPYNYGANFVHKRKIKSVDFVIGGQYYQDKTTLNGEWNGQSRITNKLRWKPKKIEGLALGINSTLYYGRGVTYFMWAGSDSLSRVPLDGTISNIKSTRISVDPFVQYMDKFGNNYNLKMRFFNATNQNNTNQGSVPNVYYAEFQYNRFFDKPQINLVSGIVSNYGTVRKPEGDTMSLLGEHNSLNLAIYAQIEKKFFKGKLNTTFGARYEYLNINSLTYGVAVNSIDNKVLENPSGFVDGFINSAGVRPMMRLGLNYNVVNATFLRFSLGEGYRFPSMAELFVQTQIGPLGVYPNLKLRPEYGWYAELGVKQGFKIQDKIQGFFDIATYINQYQNMMEFNFGNFGTSKGLSNYFGAGFSSQNVGNTRIMGLDVSVGMMGKIGNVPLQFMTGYTFIIPKSLNWNDTLFYVDVKGDKILPNQGALLLFGNATKNGGVDYASTSSSDNNMLKYRNVHTFTLDGQLSPGKWDIGASVQIRSWMENIDYAFMSPLLTDSSGVLKIFGYNGDPPFDAVKEFREKNKGMATVLVDTRIARRFMKEDQATVSFVVKNLLNQTYEIRPAFVGPSRSYAIQFSYKF